MKGAQASWKAGPTRRPAPQGGGGFRWSAQSCVPRRQSWRRMALELPYRSGLCRSAGVPARMASRAACSIAGGPLRWSAQSCVPPLQVEHAVLRATPPVLAADGVRTPAQPGIVWLCPRDRPHGQPGGMLHGVRDWVKGRAVGKGAPKPAGRRAQTKMRTAREGPVRTESGLWRRGRRYSVPAWRLRIIGRFCEKAERAITMSQPISWAFCFSSPSTWET